MKKNIRLFFLLTVTLFFGCSLNACSTTNPFYQKGSGWDYLRFPLLEPYYAIKIDDQYGWTIPLYAEPSQSNFRYYPAILKVTKIAVENGAIMVYSKYSKRIESDQGQEKELHWFILIPNQTETGFETEEEFNIGLQQYGIHQPQWQEPLSILQTFDQTRCLKWIPGCK
jgi:hypothetical protein